MAQGIDPNGLDPVGEWMFGVLLKPILFMIALAAIVLLINWAIRIAIRKLGD